MDDSKVATDSARQVGSEVTQEVPYAFTYSLHPFSVHFRPCTRAPLSWKSEVHTIARSVVNEAGARPIVVCSSGGIDSEVICRSLFAEGAHFSVLTVEHKAGTNRSDVDFARRWCGERGIEQRIVSLDISDFFSNTIERYVSEGYKSGNVFRYFQLFLLETVEKMGGYAILGGGEQLYEIGGASEPSENDVYIEFKSGSTAVLEWMKHNKAVHRPYFFYSTPESCLAYLRIPVVDFAVRNPSVFKHPANKYLFKRLVYQSLWPDIQARRRMNGYESVLEQRLAVQARLQASFGDALQSFRLPVTQFRQELEGDYAKSFSGS